MEDRKKELAKNTAIIGIGKLCTQFISFLLLPLYTATLSTSEYGMVDIINTYISLLMPIFTFQLEQGVFRFLIDARDNQTKIKTTFSTITSFVFVVSVIYAAIIFFVSEVFNIQYSVCLLLNLLSMGFSNIFLQTVRGLGNNLAYSVGSFITALATILFNIAFIVFLRWGVTGMLLATAFANTICCVFLIFSQGLYKIYSPSFFEKKVLIELMRYSVPLIPNTISWWVVSASDRTIVTWFLGVSANGILSISHKFSSMYNVIQSIFNLTWAESATLYMNAPDGEAYMNAVLKTVFNIFASVNVAIITIIPFIFSILVDEAYYAAYYQIPIHMLASLFNVIAGLYSVVYVVKKATSEIAKTTVFAAIINIIVHFVLIKLIGLYAASISSLIAYMVLAIIRYFDAQKYKRLKLSPKSLIAAIAAYVLAFIGYYSQNRIVQVFVLCIVIVYAISSNLQFIKSCFVEIYHHIQR